jgi:hypothetical protein
MPAFPSQIPLPVGSLLFADILTCAVASRARSVAEFLFRLPGDFL